MFIGLPSSADVVFDHGKSGRFRPDNYVATLVQNAESSLILDPVTLNAELLVYIWSIVRK
jgi:hypothetical protein